MPESYEAAHFPKAGLDLTRAVWEQRPRQLDKGLWAKSTPFAENVRVFDGLDRSRGGSRPGLTRLVGEQPVLEFYSQPWILQDLNLIVKTGSTVQATPSGRVVILVAVSQGNVYTWRSGETGWSSPANETGDTPPLAFDGIVRSSVVNQLMFFADGTNWVYYEPGTEKVKRWSASSGALPVDSNNNKPRLITTWRGRLVLSGLFRDPENVFFSAVTEPTTWDYFPEVTTATQAVALNTAPQGLPGDVVNCLVPYSDDVLVIGMDHTIKMMAGDPMAGGQLDLVSDEIGMCWGQSAVKTPDGTLLFVSNKAGIYAWKPGQAPQRISQPVDPIVTAINTGESGVRLGYDHRAQAVHVFITSLSGPAADTHLTLELRTNSWTTLKFKNDNHNPLAVCNYDGNTPEDRVLVLGSWDGYARAFDPDAETDDGTVIESEVWIGPLTSQTFDELLSRELVADLGEDSGDVNWAMHVGSTAEEALGSEAVETGTWSAGRNPASPARWAGHAIYVRLYGTNRWALERIRVEVMPTGPIRARSKGA